MDSTNASEINKIAANLLEFAGKIGEYRENNFDKISDKENESLKTMQTSILDYADELYTQSAIKVADEIQDSLKNINNLVEDINKTYTDLKGIQNAIDIATSIVNVGVSIISQNPGSIAKSFSNLVSVCNK